MRHKDREYEKARILRKGGCSVRDISQQLGVSRSTVSVWVRDIQLSEEQIACLNANARLAGTRGRERFTRTMQLKRQAMITRLREVAEQEYETLSRDPGLMFGLALYIGEGSKGESSALIVTNWDSRVIVKAIEFFGRLGVPHERMRCKIMLHPVQDAEAAEDYWSGVTGLPLSQFANTYQAISPGSRGKRGQKWPHGGCQLSISSIELRYKMNRWMELALQA
jgi:hypothetical protein